MMKRSAILSENEVYRYTLERTWHDQKERILFVMLNPSTADANVDDATIRRCKDFAKRWDYGGLVVGNLFALRSKDPKALFDHPCPKGPENDAHLQRLAEECGAVVVAWGNSAKAFQPFRERQESVKQLLRGRMQCLGTNMDGTPKHPVRLPAAAQLRPYRD